MRVAVFGLGYVGCVSAACLVKDGHQVIGVDVNEDKVALLNQGASPIVEGGLRDLVAEGRRSGRLRATRSAADAIVESDVALVCVGTPTDAAGRIDLQYLERVTREIGAAVGTVGSRRYTVVFRSTMVPGTLEDRLLPLLVDASGRRPGALLGVAVNPEFLREGTAVRDYYAPPIIVIGETDARSGDEVAALYAGIEAPVERVSLRTAEMVKYASNAFHALKISFANEIGRIAKAAGVDGPEVMRVLCLDRKLNISPAYLRPGFAFGGSCLPKDLRALVAEAGRRAVAAPLLQATLSSNEEHKRDALRILLGAGRRRVAVLGLAFKEGTDDLRESPLVELVESLIGRGYPLAIFDRNVSLARLVGANRRFIEHEIPHIDRLLVGTIDDALREAEIVVVGNNDPEFTDVVAKLPAGRIVVDLVGLRSRPPAGVEYHGVAW